MNRCGDCKWWAAHKHVDDDERFDCSDFRFHPHRAGFGICLRSIVPYRTTEFKSDKMQARDASDYYAQLETAPDFGCTEWELKP